MLDALVANIRRLSFLDFSGLSRNGPEGSLDSNKYNYTESEAHYGLLQEQ